MLGILYIAAALFFFKYAIEKFVQIVKAIATLFS